MLICMIPARLGSQRLKKKNLALFNGITLIEHAVRRAIESDCFDEIWVNSESTEILEEGKKSGAQCHRRAEFLANNTATSEDFVEEFLRLHECDYLVQLHTIAPLLSSSEIRDFVDYLRTQKPDTLLACENIQLEAMYQNKPINFNFNKKTNSQELEPVKKISWAITAWKRESFIRTKNEGKCATYNGKVSLFSIKNTSSVVIKSQEDLDLAKFIYNVQFKTR